MKKTMKKILLTLLLTISLFNAGIVSYSAATMQYTEGYNIELHSFEEDENYDRPILRI